MSVQDLLYHYQCLNGRYIYAQCAGCGITFRQHYLQEAYLPHICVNTTYDWAMTLMLEGDVEGLASILFRLQACGNI